MLTSPKCFHSVSIVQRIDGLAIATWNHMSVSIACHFDGAMPELFPERT
jgi:hypothetical protein